MAGEIAPLSKRMGNPSVVSNGYQYRILGKNSELVTGCVLKSNAVCAKGS
jgi:hypothetical protein